MSEELKEGWIKEAIQEADNYWGRKSENFDKKIYSYIRDEEGHQYVDLVMEGGGMLGIALVGYTYILEKAGIRFRKLAGTSAGAINAMMMASLDKPANIKSEKLLSIMNNKNFYDFVDGPEYVKKSIETFMNGLSIWKALFNISNLIRSVKYLIRNRGLNPGKDFHDWAQSILEDVGVKNTFDLKNRYNSFPKKLMYDDSNGVPFSIEFDKIENFAELAIVATDVNTETRAIFPKKACLYWENVDDVHPADYIRASMSVPLFFHPFRVNDIPKGENANENWERIQGVTDLIDIPINIDFVDGGLVSNFPFDIFHIPKKAKKLPMAPTFGVKLGKDSYNKTKNNILKLMGAILNSSRHMLDNNLRVSYPEDYKALVREIEIDEDINWLNFNMPHEQKKSLFIAGAKVATDYLAEFDFRDYIHKVRAPGIDNKLELELT